MEKEKKKHTKFLHGSGICLLHGDLFCLFSIIRKQNLGAAILGIELHLAVCTKLMMFQFQFFKQQAYTKLHLFFLDMYNSRVIY